MKNKWMQIALAALFLAAAFCAVATTSRIFHVENLPADFLAAFLGAVITAVITVVLLAGQSSAEEIKERNVKVFEKKTEVFQDYINMIWDIWADQKVTAEEFEKLTSGYYRTLMIFLDDKNKFEDKLPTKVIAQCITDIGKYIDEPCFGTKRDELRNNIITIINVLSGQIGLGGRIDKDIIENHDKQMFPKMFRKMLLDAFNAGFRENYPDIFKEGAWQTWMLQWQKKSYTQDTMVFNFQKYPDCGIRIGIYNFNTADDEKGPEREQRLFQMFLIIPRKYRAFDPFRDTTYRWWFAEHIMVEPLNTNLFKPFDADNEAKNTEPFDFTDTSLEFIREKVDSQKEAIVLADRAVKALEEMKVIDGDVKLSIMDFMEKYYPRQNAG